MPTCPRRDQRRNPDLPPAAARAGKSRRDAPTRAMFIGSSGEVAAQKRDSCPFARFRDPDFIAFLFMAHPPSPRLRLRKIADRLVPYNTADLFFDRFFPLS